MRVSEKADPKKGDAIYKGDHTPLQTMQQDYVLEFVTLLWSSGSILK